MMVGCALSGGPPMRRRDFITLIGGMAAARPLAARAQQGDRVRRIGVLTSGDENDPLEKIFVSAFTQALADLGWTDGRNARLDLLWAGGDINRIRAFALTDPRQCDILRTVAVPPSERITYCVPTGGTCWSRPKSAGSRSSSPRKRPAQYWMSLCDSTSNSDFCRSRRSASGIDSARQIATATLSGS